MKNLMKKAICEIATTISPEFNIKLRYYVKHKKKIDLQTPKSFIEKLCYLQLYRYNDDELVEICADKVQVRTYVADLGYEHLLCPVYGIYDDIEEVPFDSLPEEFVLKYNFGCGFLHICREKKDLDIKSIKQKFNKWSKITYGKASAELQYGCPKKIICEKFLKSDTLLVPIDYKLYVLNGVVRCAYVVSGRFSDEYNGRFYDVEWNHLPSEYDKKELELHEKPKGLKEMIECAETLAKHSNFPFVRVDFYQINGKVYFGEMTFTPMGSLSVQQCQLGGKNLGEYLDIT